MYARALTCECIEINAANSKCLFCFFVPSVVEEKAKIKSKHTQIEWNERKCTQQWQKKKRKSKINKINEKQRRKKKLLKLHLHFSSR